ncbi:MAG: helix-turn-helix transcriptional regulator [Bacteroidales bacterium]|nr:helix-turn-helix transcriptional regulator [Bacteroidales bacterium]
MREYLKQMRIECGLTMEDAAEKIGISKQYYSMIEAGERQRNMDISLVSRIANVFGKTLEFIVAEEQKLVNAQK